MKKSMHKAHKARTIILGILSALFTLILVFAIITAVNADRNVKAMDSVVDAALTKLSQSCTVTEEPCGEYEHMTVYGIMGFDVKRYDVDKIGNLSVMKLNMGVMQMATIILTPFDKNLPMVSADYIYMLGSRKCYYEFYDLVEAKDNEYNALLAELQALKGTYSALADVETKAAWYDELKTVALYKSGNADDDSTLCAMLTDGLGIYLNAAERLPELSDEERRVKNELTVSYTEGLIQNGGVSTDAFVSSLGEDVTRAFFESVLFGTAAYAA